MEKEILYSNEKIEFYLNLFFKGKKENLFDILNKIGIDCDVVFLHDLDTTNFFGNIYYIFNCDIGDKKVIFKGDLFDDSLHKNFITVYNENNISSYSYSKGEIKPLELENKPIEFKNKKFFYENRKTKKYLKRFFFNDETYEKRLLEIIKNLGIKNGSVYVHSLDKYEDFYTDKYDFSLICHCNDENNSSLELKYGEYNNRILEKIIFNSSDGYKEYNFDCLLNIMEERRQVNSKKIKVKTK